MSRDLHHEQVKAAEPSTVLHRLLCTPANAGWQFVPSGAEGALTPSTSFSPEVHSRVENEGGRRGKEQGVGQRRKRAEERRATCLKKSKIVIPQLNRGTIT